MNWAQRIIDHTLRMEKAGRWKIGVLVTDNREIRRIHKKFMKDNTATDVMAFHLGPRCGDIVVSAEMAKKVAKKLGIGFREELARYLVHGTLHLLGYRDKAPRDRIKMWKKQEGILHTTPL